eukprot:TRINITY_DN5701_c0_g1_i1.p1 TRINITY_DN5701_c0_g1~~TRINITY_DN5701_c0_g1_i1.p1  ORF type:complete len:259 (+),score=64.36 TRINITY_DN5701_c0_g1_i1:114-890(+)
MYMHSEFSFSPVSRSIVVASLFPSVFSAGIRTCQPSSMSTSTSHIKAVCFDLGGVVLKSPFPAILSFEKKHGLTPYTIPGVIRSGGDNGAWSRLERSEVSYEQFCSLFSDEIHSKCGVRVDVDCLMREMEGASGARPEFIRAIKTIKSHGLTCAAITNTYHTPRDSFFEHLLSLFDEVISSRDVGLRKPEPEIYLHALSLLKLKAEECVFIDDLGANLKTAKHLGFHTILCRTSNPNDALRQLGDVLGLALVPPAASL